MHHQPTKIEEDEECKTNDGGNCETGGVADADDEATKETSTDAMEVEESEREKEDVESSDAMVLTAADEPKDKDEAEGVSLLGPDRGLDSGMGLGCVECLQVRLRTLSTYNAFAH